MRRPLPFCWALLLARVSARNVLYIAVDDLRSDIGAYGLPVKTPNIDALAATGLRFNHSYCQLSVCAPSRMSFMTSRRPDTFGVWNFIDTVPNTTLSTPRMFRDAGYLTLGLGKTFHQDQGAWNEANTWTPPADGGLAYYPYESGTCPFGNEGGGHCMKDDLEIYDWNLTQTTLEYLDYAASAARAAPARPFFLMTGFRKPHAPWEYPARMWDLYADDEIATAAFDTLGRGTPQIAWSNQLNVQLENGSSYAYSPYSAVPEAVQRDQRRAYYADVSYVDEHVGAILTRLDEHGLADETAVVFHADHGYHLGEHGEWEKKSNFDLVVRVPLIVRVPWKPRAVGATAAALVELIDVMPTLAGLLELPAPDVDGADVSVVFDDPTAAAEKDAAYHQYPACGVTAWNATREACNSVPKEQFDVMSYSVRTYAWRYTLWLPWDNTTLTATWDDDSVDELYAHAGDDSTDLDRWENTNLALDPAYAHVTARLRAKLQAHFAASA